MQGNFFEKLKAVIFPNRCIVCEKLTENKYFCKHCEGTLKPFSVKLCPRCGSPLKNCSCGRYFYYFDKIRAAFANEGAAKNSFYYYKFGGYLNAANYFADQMVKVAKEDFKGIHFDAVTFVPMHISKRLDRGYNQSEKLARKVARRLKLPCSPLLKERKRSKAQHTKTSIVDRFVGVKGRYSILKSARIRGKTVLLVDDIMTTGATLSECARLLKLEGAERVFALCALKTIYKEKSESPT